MNRPRRRTTPRRRRRAATKQNRSNLFVFVTNREVPDASNACERALRPSVIFRKATNGFRSVRGAELFAAVRSVIDTGPRHDRSVLQANRATLDRTSVFMPA